MIERERIQMYMNVKENKKESIRPQSNYESSWTIKFSILF